MSALTFCPAESNDLDARAAEVASMLAATIEQTVEDQDNASEHSTVAGPGAKR
jgi:hypothetical protein